MHDRRGQPHGARHHDAQHLHGSGDDSRLGNRPAKWSPATCTARDEKRPDRPESFPHSTSSAPDRRLTAPPGSPTVSRTGRDAARREARDTQDRDHRIDAERGREDRAVHHVEIVDQVVLEPRVDDRDSRVFPIGAPPIWCAVKSAQRLGATDAASIAAQVALAPDPDRRLVERQDLPGRRPPGARGPSSLSLRALLRQGGTPPVGEGESPVRALRDGAAVLFRRGIRR